MHQAHTPFEDPAAAAALERGALLFNAGAFWEAHEAWELGWRGAREPEATTLKGMIQSAAALVHWRRGNPRGLARNWHKARPRLVAASALIPQFDLNQFVADMDRLIVHNTEYGIPAPRLRWQSAPLRHDSPVSHSQATEHIGPETHVR